jgi:hypothetical protein
MKLAWPKTPDRKTGPYKTIYMYSINCCRWIQNSVLFSLKDTRLPKSLLTQAKQYCDYLHFCSVLLKIPRVLKVTLPRQSNTVIIFTSVEFFIYYSWKQ